MTILMTGGDPIPDSQLDWIECWHCGGDGEIELYEDDPLWYDVDDVQTCEICNGKGGWRGIAEVDDLI